MIISSVKLLIKKLIWRSRNRRNFTTVGNPGFPLNKVSVGCGTYGVLTIIAFGSELEKVNIGNFCSIADGVSILLGGEHRTSSISTFPFSSMYGGQVTAVSKGPVTIDDDVWIGYRATILSGVHIGQGAVVGACALITKDVPPYAVVGGVPAKVIGWRFDEESRQLASMIDYSMLDPTLLENYALLEKEACITSLKDAIEQIERKSNLEGREHD